MRPVPPETCHLCGAAAERIVSARFQQIYRQQGAPCVFLDWWECRACRGWFLHPVPTPEALAKHWATVPYAEAAQASRIAQEKAPIHQRLLTGCARRTTCGPLLDFGCSFGEFLLSAAEAGWQSYGFEPQAEAAAKAREKGFEVRSGWTLESAGFEANMFSALVANDVFYYVWHPWETLHSFHRVLRPGGVLAMRISNKRLALGAARALTPTGLQRNTRLSRMLQGQFHSIALRSLGGILEKVGFDPVEIEPRAATAPLQTSAWHTKTAYHGADWLYALSGKQINLSPGVLLFARKHP